MSSILTKLSLEMISRAILKSAKKEVNSACFFIGYQPNLPQTAKRLRKF